MQSQRDSSQQITYAVDWVLTRVDSNSDLHLSLWKVWYGKLLGGVEDVQSGVTDLHYMPCAIWLGQTRHQHVGIANGFHLGTKG